MIGKSFNAKIVGFLLFNSLCRQLATLEAGEVPTNTDTATERECPTNNNSVCVKGYLHLVECFKHMSENQENFTFAFFPNNEANSLYVTVTYKVHYENNDSYNATDNGHASSYINVEEWVWSHTMVYIMYHPSLFKFLTIGYGMIDERVSSVELTIPRLCHDNNNNYKLIERLTQMVRCYHIRSYLGGYFEIYVTIPEIATSFYYNYSHLIAIQAS